MNKQTKQLAIIGVLGAVLLAVGAFQFMTPVPVPPMPPDVQAEKANSEAATEPAAVPAGAPAEAVPAGAQEEPVSKADPIREALLTYATSNASPRDPFKPAGSLATEMASPQGKVAPANAAPVYGNPSESESRPTRQSPPPQQVPPMDPLAGTLQGGPQVALQSPGAGQSGVGGPAAIDPRTFTGGPSYKVKGILVGNTRMVVLEDAEGNQKLVPEGGSVDGDTTIVKIRDNTVKISTRGRRKDVPLEEERR